MKCSQRQNARERNMEKRIGSMPASNLEIITRRAGYKRARREVAEARKQGLKGYLYSRSTTGKSYNVFQVVKELK